MSERIATLSKTGLNLRLQAPSDKGYCLGTWANNAYDNGMIHRHTPNPVYYYHMNRIVDHHWDESQWLMLSGNSNEDWLVGFLCGLHTEGATYIHYIYLREKYRGKGVGRYMVYKFLGLDETGNRDDNLVYYSTMTRFAREWRRDHLGSDRNDGETWLGRTWMYNPFSLTYRMEEGWYL